MDPGFWADDRPLAPAGFAGGLPGLEVLAGQVLFESSGSGGPPKWLALSKEALLLSAAAVNTHLRVTADSCWGLALPWYHVGGFGVLARAFEAGCRCRTFQSRWQAAGFQDWLVKHRVTHTSLVPAQVHDLTAAGITAPPGLRAVVVGGGRLAGDPGRAARALGWPVLASYGMTEAGSQIATQGLELLETSYKPTLLEVLPIWRVRATAMGRLEIAGPALFSGTLVQAGDEWRFEPRRGQWHVTADRGVIDDGRLTPLGRMDLIVKVLGELVDPERIEEELLEAAQGGLRAGQFAVVALPDARAEHRLVPVFEDAVPPQVIAAVLAEYHDRAPGFQRLQKPVSLPALPRSPLGKVRRTELAGWLASI